MARFVLPSEYRSLTIGQLKSERASLDTIAYIEEFFYLDNFKAQVCEFGPEIVRKLPASYLDRVLKASKIVRRARKLIDLIDLEIAWRF